MPLKALPRQKRLQQQLLLKQTQNQQSEVDDDISSDVVDLDLHRGYNRPKLITVNLWDDDTELPERITKRLAEIRDKALQKYRENMI